MMFWDASAIIPLCITEKYTEAMVQLILEDSLMAVWWGTIIECYSAFARLRRDGTIDINGGNHSDPSSVLDARLRYWMLDETRQLFIQHPETSIQHRLQRVKPFLC